LAKSAALQTSLPEARIGLPARLHHRVHRELHGVGGREGAQHLQLVQCAEGIVDHLIDRQIQQRSHAPREHGRQIVRA
jgi:hypothetical protein